MNSRLLACLIATTSILVSASGLANPNKKARRDVNNGQLELVDFSEALSLKLSESFVKGEARVQLKLTVSRDTRPRCGEVVISVERKGERIEIVVEGIRRLALVCAMEAPPAPSATVDLTNDLGHHELVIKRQGQSDDFSLEINAKDISLRATRPPGLTVLETEGTLLRAPPHSIWVTVRYSLGARQRFQEETRDLLQALAGVGARRFEPAPGQYATRGAWSALDPNEPPSTSFPPPAIDCYFFHYDGEFEPLAGVVERWKRYDKQYVDDGSSEPYMRTHIDGWHGRWVSTSPQTLSPEAYRHGRQLEAEERSRRTAKAAKQKHPKDREGDIHGSP